MQSSRRLFAFEWFPFGFIPLGNQSSSESRGVQDNSFAVCFALINYSTNGMQTYPAVSSYNLIPHLNPVLNIKLPLYGNLTLLDHTFIMYNNGGAYEFSRRFEI